MKKIYIIRHAESQGNAGMITPSFADISLTDNGKQQAIKFAGGCTIIPQLIVASEYIRTQQTAQYLKERFPYSKFEIWKDTHEFTFLDRSKCVGTVEQERRIIAQTYWDKCDPFYRDGPLEETFFEFLLRTQNFVRDLKARKEDIIMAISHGRFMRAVRLVGKIEKPLNDIPRQEIVALMKDFPKFEDTFDVKNLQMFTLDELIQ